MQLEKAPITVYFDPEFKVFAVLKVKQGLQQWLRWLRSEYVYMKLLTARKLADFKNKKAVEALEETLLTDGFWGVRAEAAKSLGKIGTEEAKKALLRALKRVKELKVRMAIVEALGNFSDKDVAEALPRVLRDENEGYYTRANAARSLGKTKLVEYEEALKEALAYESHNDVIKRGALQGLAELRTDGAFEVIKEHTDRKYPTLVRATATLCLAKFLDKAETYELLARLSKDENYRVRQAVTMAAKEMLSPRLIGILEEMAEKDPHELIRRYAREALERIRKAMERGEEYRKLREELEKLREAHRELLDKIARLESK